MDYYNLLIILIQVQDYSDYWINLYHVLIKYKLWWLEDFRSTIKNTLIDNLLLSEIG